MSYYDFLKISDFNMLILINMNVNHLIILSYGWNKNNGSNRRHVQFKMCSMFLILNNYYRLMEVAE